MKVFMVISSDLEELWMHPFKHKKTRFKASLVMDEPSLRILHCTKLSIQDASNKEH